MSQTDTEVIVQLIGVYYKQTKDIETLRRILGHTDISTTTIYITLANIDIENGMKSFKGFE